MDHAWAALTSTFSFILMRKILNLWRWCWKLLELLSFPHSAIDHVANKFGKSTKLTLSGRGWTIYKQTTFCRYLMSHKQHQLHLYSAALEGCHFGWIINQRWTYFQSIRWAVSAKVHPGNISRLMSEFTFDNGYLFPMAASRRWNYGRKNLERKIWYILILFDHFAVLLNKWPCFHIRSK